MCPVVGRLKIFPSKRNIPFQHQSYCVQNLFIPPSGNFGFSGLFLIILRVSTSISSFENLDNASATAFSLPQMFTISKSYIYNYVTHRSATSEGK
ncbi:hypothetical protein AYI68_g7940 [Smittium mucronatum]|uniref:Uncharacterized protein n=1 Tax=Smittium mucronatum TaxID=133383 RepID=A0A1R0GMA1_9FUNG|nr:hypothetical protein AYI68_g7940 [Smittium mucronatum]